MKSGSMSSYRAALSGTGADFGGEQDDDDHTPDAMQAARELAAQAWCAESTRNKVMDVELAEQFAIILHDAARVGGHQELSLEELTERFYLVRGQRDRLLWACEKALAAFDAANETGKSNWKGEDVEAMRAAVKECRP